MIKMARPEQDEALWVVADRIRFIGPVLGSSLELIEVGIPQGPEPRRTRTRPQKPSISSMAN